MGMSSSKSKSKEKSSDKSKDKTKNNSADKSKDKTRDKSQDKSKEKPKEKSKSKSDEKLKDETKDKKEESKKSDEKDKSEESEEKEDSPEDLESLFEKYAKFGDRESDGTITLRNIDKWLKQAKILENKELGIKNADTAITFAKIVKHRKRMNFEEFKEFMESLASDKKMEVVVLNDMLVAAGSPSMTNVTSPVETAHMRRMTDTKLYTGAHKARFDEEGKGRGIEGREDRHSHTGEVSGYKKPSTDKKKESNDKIDKE